MRRRTAMLLTLVACGATATAFAPWSSAAPAAGSVPAHVGSLAYPPEPCPPEPVLSQENGNYYVTSPGIGTNCTRVRVEVPVHVEHPGRTDSPTAFPPEPCPVRPLITQSSGQFIISIPIPGCQWITVTIPNSIKWPPAGVAGSIPNPLTFPPPCPPGPLVYESNGHDYVSVPDPTGHSCRLVIELPVTVPPMLG